MNNGDGMTGSKAWYFSRAIWSGVAAIIAGIAQIFGVHVEQEELRDGLLAVAGPIGTIGGAAAVWFRAKAETRLTR